MDRVIVGVLIAAVGALALPINFSVEILRNPSQVTILRPELPIFVRFADNSTAPESGSNLTIVNNFPDFSNFSVGEVENVQVNTTDITADQDDLNLNSTCIRQDFENHGAAVFYPPPGSLETAILIFNSTAEYPFFGRLNATDLAGLALLNQTEVGCLEYEEPAYTRRLSPGALASLAG